MSLGGRGQPLADAASTPDLAFWPLLEDMSVGEGDPCVAIPPDRKRWIAFAPRQALVHPEFAAVVDGCALFRPDVDIFYADDAALGATDGWGVRLKPALNPSLLASQDYVGAPLIVRASALHKLGGLRREAGTAALYDLLLRALAAGSNIERICETLVTYPGERPEPRLADRRAVLEAWLARQGGALDVIDGLTPGTLRLRRRFAERPAVTLLVPTCQSAPPGGSPHVLAMLDSVAGSTWPMDRLKVLIGDDVASDAVYRDRRWPFEVRRLLTERPAGAPFNYAAKMNTLWRAADTEHVVMMNDDLVVQSPDWLEALMTFAVDQDIGGVGARLVYADGGLQHAGMVGGPFDLFVHAWARQPADLPTYQNWALVQRDWSAVTGAVFATRKSVLEAVNGYDERFSLEYNDVDLCLRMGVLGYRIVYAADAQLLHHEKASRGATPPPGSETARFLRRWQGMIMDDPMGHPSLARDSFALGPAYEATC